MRGVSDVRSQGRVMHSPVSRRTSMADVKQDLEQHIRERAYLM
jgi:hypothetical protein